MSSCSTWIRFFTFQSTILSFRMGFTALLSWMSTLAVALYRLGIALFTPLPRPA